MVRMNISISNELARELGVLSAESDTTKSEILRKAFALFVWAKEAKSEGKKLALVGDDGQVTAEVIGL